MKKFIVFWLFLAFLFGGSLAYSLTLTIDLKEEIEVVGPKITLKEMADLSYPDSYWQEKIGGLEFDFSFFLGEERIVTAQDIYQRIVTQSVPQLDYIYFSGATSCRLVVKGDNIGRNDLSRILEKELSSLFSFARKIEVFVSSPSANIWIPPNSEVEVSFPGSLRPWGRRQAQMVFKEGEEGKEKTVPVSFELKVYREVIRAKENITRGSLIDEEMVYASLEAIDYRSEKAFGQLEEVLGKEAKRSFSAGDLLIPSGVEEETLIQRGDMVVMVASCGGTTVTALGKSRGTGSMGDLIVVENVDSRERVQGEIVGDRMVEVVVK